MLKPDVCQHLVVDAGRGAPVEDGPVATGNSGRTRRKFWPTQPAPPIGALTLQPCCDPTRRRLRDASVAPVPHFPRNGSPMRRASAAVIACCALVLTAGCGSTSKSASSSSTTATTTTTAAGGGLKGDTAPKYEAPSVSAPVQSGVVEMPTATSRSTRTRSG